MTSALQNGLTLKEGLRTGMRRLASGVSVIALAYDNKRFAMTASSVTSLSDDPASLIVCINADASIYSLMRAGQQFSVNVLSYSQQDISMACAQKELGEKRFETGLWSQYESEVPYLQESEATFICSVDSKSVNYGTHLIAIGKVVDVITPATDADPLLYANGAYHKVS